jgi:HK97 family phage prohead protease
MSDPTPTPADLATVVTRQFHPDLEVRAEKSGRTIAGIVVPFERVARVSDGGPAYDEAFRMGAFTKTISERQRPLKLLSQHRWADNPLGVSTMLREDTAGLYGEFKVSKTPEGDAALELARDGALDSFSIGFRPIKHVTENKVKVRTEVALKETSLVTFPSYDDAVVTAVRQAFPQLEEMTDEQRAEFLATVQRDIDLTGTTQDAEPVSDPTEPDLHSARRAIAWNNFRASLIQKGIK